MSTSLLQVMVMYELVRQIINQVEFKYPSSPIFSECCKRILETLFIQFVKIAEHSLFLVLSLIGFPKV